ncbi:MAG: bifunctional oligoribonuclease/PAP phosphatase NrnA [Anaerolineae bacterium]|nr:bifunctional oligoribonuclease/PAP phosphatase NrnA [Anaerolineae bacterium]
MDPRIPRMIEEAERILLVTHISPDGDAIGSLLGMGWALRAIGKTPFMVCGDPVPTPFYFLPGHQEIKREPPDDYDLAIGLDASDPQRLGTPWQRVAQVEKPTIIIDHHVTNLYFGQVNWVDPTAAATAEMVFVLVEVMGIPLDINIAQCLLCGVVTDTRGFRTSNTTPRSLAIATQLMEAGADLNLITDQALNRKPLAVLRLWGMALPRMQMRGRILWTTVTRKMREETGVNENGDGGLVNVLISANEADVAAVFTERENNKIEVGLRAKPGFDVSQVALALGGGGHPQAAGCTINGPLDEAAEHVLSALEESLNRQAGG